jgi:hypothetical protein
MKNQSIVVPGHQPALPGQGRWQIPTQCPIHIRHITGAIDQGPEAGAFERCQRGLLGFCGLVCAHEEFQRLTYNAEHHTRFKIPASAEEIQSA